MRIIPTTRLASGFKSQDYFANNGIRQNKITNTLSFKGDTKEVSGNEITENFSGKTYKGSDNTKAGNITADKVFLTDNAKIENLTLPKGHTSKTPYPEFKCNYSELGDNDVPYEADIVLKDNSSIENVKTKDSLDIRLICEKGIPFIKNISGEYNRKHYNFQKNIQHKTLLQVQDILIKDNAILGDIESKNIYIKDFGKAKSITTNFLTMKNNAYVEKAKTKYNPDLYDNAYCGEIEVDEVLPPSTYSYTKLLGIKDNVKIGTLKIKDEGSNVCLGNNSEVKKILNKNGYVKLAHNAKSQEINSRSIELTGNAFADTINTTGYAEINNFAKVNKLNTTCNVVAKGNSTIGDINVLDGSNNSVILQGNAKLTGKIIFLKEKGTVELQPDYETGETPKIDVKQVVNATIIDHSKPKSPNTEQSKSTNLRGFAKVAGMDELKEELRIDVIEPLLNPEKYAKYQLKPVNGILLYGPPGCGKTFIAEALAEELGRNFESISGSDISDSGIMGVSTSRIKDAFKRAYNKVPSILFIDEVDSIAPSRDKIEGSAAGTDISNQVTTLLTELNNIGNKKVLVIFATNEPQKVDNAIKRTGRMDKKFCILPPDYKARNAMIRMYSQNRYVDKSINYDRIAEQTENYSSSDIKAIVDQAVRNAARENSTVLNKHFEKALSQIRPSLNEYLIDEYKRKGEI